MTNTEQRNEKGSRMKGNIVKYKVTFEIETSSDLDAVNLSSMEYALDKYGFYLDERIIKATIEKLPNE